MQTRITSRNVSTRRCAYWVMTRLARVLVRVFFRSIELDGGDLVPSSGPLVLVANHTNGLVDGLLLMATLSRYPRFLGKSTLFRIPPLWPFLKLAGVIPVFRAMDAVAGDRNDAAFATSRTILRSGGVVAVFPEGISHDDHTLHPLKTGTARIVLDAEANGIEGVSVVAVGLTFDAKSKFRSRVLVRVAPAMDGAPDLHSGDARDSVRALTERVGVQLTSVCPTFSSPVDADVWSHMAEIVVRPPRTSFPADVDLGDQLDTAARLSAASQGSVTGPVTPLRSAFTAYARDLDLIGLSDAQVSAGYPPGRLRLTVGCGSVKVVFALPAVVVGVAVHIVPFQIVKRLARQPANEGIKATVKLLTCFVSFLLVYATCGIVVGNRLGWLVGTAVAVGAPACGYATVMCHERIRRTAEIMEGYRKVRRQRSTIESIRGHRAAVMHAAHALIGTT